MDIHFQPPKLEDQRLINDYFRRFPSRSCERCFVNTYLWSLYENIEFAEVEETLVVKRVFHGQSFFAWPAGDREHIAKALAALEQYADHHLGEKLRLSSMTPSQFELLQQIQPDRWEITYNRDFADYIYDREKLETLSGKKLHGKRNHIHRFEQAYPSWHYDVLTEDNLEDARAVALIWRRENMCDITAKEMQDTEKGAEMCVCLRELELFRELGLSGGILYADERPVAFSLGERLSDDTFVVHIEKALADVQGAYPLINREFVRHECQGVRFVNREDDAGEPGLRRAKLSYKPIILEEKGVATCKVL